MAPSPSPTLCTTTGTHLRASAGRWFWLRGVVFFLSYRILLNGNLQPFLLNLNESTLPVRILGYLLIATVFTNWQVTWVHAVIARPSTKSFLERLIWFRCSGTITSALAMQIKLNSTTLKCAYFVQDTLLQRLGLDFAPHSAYQSWIPGILPNTIHCLLSIAARMVFLRAAASTLPSTNNLSFL